MHCSCLNIVLENYKETLCCAAFSRYVQYVIIQPELIRILQHVWKKWK